MESFTKRCRPLQMDLAGFWSRGAGTSLTGVLMKYVANDKKKRPFFIFHLTIAGAPIRVEADTERQADVGEYVGVAANWSVTSVLDKVEDIGKTFRLTCTGEAPNPKGGNPMKLIDVEELNAEIAPV